MVDSSRFFRILKYLATLFLFVYLYKYLRTPSARVTYSEIVRSFQSEKKLFVADYLSREIDGPFSGADLERLCASRTWYPNDKAVVLSCEPIAGGVASVKNGHLHCIRFAIEIGAQLILPRIQPRSSADISNIHGGQQSKGLSLDYMFDQQHLVDSLRTHCPQMKVHASLDDLYDRPSLLAPLKFSFDVLPLTRAVLNDTPTTVLMEPQNLKLQFTSFFDSSMPPNSRHYPVRVHLAETFFAWPTHSDGEAFRRDFGRILRIRPDIKALAASALWNLARGHDLVLDPRRGLETYDSGHGKGNSFLAVHLRTEKDSSLSHFPGYDDQTRYFLNNLAAHPARVVYLATGLDPAHPDVQRFRARAADLNATVVLRHDLLSASPSSHGDDPEAAASSLLALGSHLTWDQRALVDYEIMLHAGHVLGLVESSLDWNIALRRAAAFGGGGPGSFVAVPVAGVHPENMAMWWDRYSTLYGSTPSGVSMYLGIWP